MKNLLKDFFTSTQNTTVVDKSNVDWSKVNKGDRNGLFATKKTTEELIKEIHDTFYTEVDRLLEFAKIQKPVETTEQEVNLIEKSYRLRNLGFNKTKEVLKGREIEDRENEIKNENSKKQDLIQTINYFSTKYPQYKFITEESVKKICQKYNLIYGTVDKYIGTVPDKNLAEIEKFNISENDCCYQQRSVTRDLYTWKESEIIYYMDETSYHKFKDTKGFKPLLLPNTRNFFEKCPLEIAAPKDDFDIEGMQITDSKLEKAPVKIPDPIVLQPVFHNEEKHYLIVTAWGLEASDELVVNHKMN